MIEANFGFYSARAKRRRRDADVNVLERIRRF
jgi:hypothetical protein